MPKANPNHTAAHYVQADWKISIFAEKIKVIQKTEKLGAMFAGIYLNTDEIMEMLNILVDRELKVAFLKGFEASLARGIPVTEETKNYLHYENLRNKRVA